jgi:hypothetical protein
LQFHHYFLEKDLREEYYQNLLVREIVLLHLLLNHLVHLL